MWNYNRHFLHPKLRNFEICDYCWRMDEYSSYFNKYYIKQDKYAEFMQTCFSNETIISLHSPNYAQNVTSSLYPTRIVLVKNKTNIKGTSNYFFLINSFL